MHNSTNPLFCVVELFSVSARFLQHFSSFNMATALPPKAVSPLIKFCRYSALITGLIYGRSRYNSLTEKEKVIQVEENKIRVIRDARLKAERENATNVEMNNLATDFGIQKKAV